jgi:hypothetical protein
MMAGIKTRISNHTFRATGITQYLRNGGRRELAQQMAAVGNRFSNADLAFLSPYGTSNLKRFGNFPTDLMPDPVPVERGLPS